MRISQYIEKLQALQSEHGDLEVEKCRFDGSRIEANAPEIAHRKILRPRQRREEFWFTYSSDQASKGEKVVRV